MFRPVLGYFDVPVFQCSSVPDDECSSSEPYLYVHKNYLQENTKNINITKL